MTPATSPSRLTRALAQLTGTNTRNASRRLGASEPATNTGADTGADTEAEAFDVWPRDNQRLAFHPFYDCRRIAAQYEADQDKAREFFLPQYKQLGAERDDPGALAVYERHRIIERQVATFLFYEVSAYAESCGLLQHSEALRRLAIKMYSCRTAGMFGIGTHGKPVIAWDSKCSQAKLCPDESRHEAQRLFDRYADAIDQHQKKGGRVYKVWPTLPNYPLGRLREGKRHIFKRWRDRIVRAQKNKQKKFPHVGSLMIQEDPQGAGGDWNVHLNGILLTDGWLNYAELREAWGCNIEIRQHKLRSKAEHRERDLRELFNEMVKYSVRTVPEKSGSKHSSEAPAFIDWTPAAALEWYQANLRFRRSRSYGSLFRIGKPDREPVMPLVFFGSLEWQPTGYRVTWRRHNLAHLVKGMLTWDRGTLDLIRGNNSTSARGARQPTGPP